jgi:hypothetical protein
MNAIFSNGGGSCSKKISEHFQVHAFLRDIPGAENALGAAVKRPNVLLQSEKMKVLLNCMLENNPRPWH